MSIVSRIRPELAGLAPYGAAQQLENTVRLNANESPFTPCNNTFERPLNRYPEIRPQRLRKNLAERFGCTESELLVTRGSSEAIDLLIRVFCTAGQDRIMISSPGFSMYAHYALIQNAGVLDVPLTSGYQLDTEAVIAAIDDSVKLVFLCSPNNPTGALIPEADILEILDAATGRAAVVVDEAYIEFSNQSSLSATVSRYSNLIVLRTLSKAMGLAGARCGCLIAEPALVGVLDAVQAPYAVSTPVVASAIDALESAALERSEENIETLKRERDRVAKELQAMSAVQRVWPSDANFLLVEFNNRDAADAAARNAGLLLRSYGDKLPDSMRITIGTEAENDKLLQTLSALEVTA